MARRMLINSVHAEETRIAITEDKELVELEIESNFGKKLKGNIYKAKISRIEPSLQAAFVDIGTQRNGFLQINDIHPAYFSKKLPKGVSGTRIPIQDVLHAGQELIVQVVKEERDLKGATLTTFLSLPGRYIVLMPGSDRGGVSRKISDSDQRVRLKKLARELEMPDGMGLIVRTAGLDRSQSELSRDLNLQLKLWEQTLEDAQSASCPTALYEESNVATRVIRDYFTPDIREIIIDNPATFKSVKQFVEQVMPRYRSRVKQYSEEQPLFTHYRIDDQVAGTLNKEVKLKSGGAIVIDSLEALVAIDVNSGKATTGGTIEDTAYHTNLEAAEEIAKQLRLRDIGGLIVIDFIDMTDRRHKAAVEKRVLEAVSTDKARIEVGRLSRFGLLEMSRQRLRASLSSQSTTPCPHCRGSGKVKSHELVALEALRKIQSAVIVGNVQTVKTRLSPSAALFLLNNKKWELAQLEKEHNVIVYILADGRMRPDEVQFEMETGSIADTLEEEKSERSEKPSESNSNKRERQSKPKGKLRGRGRSKRSTKRDSAEKSKNNDDAENSDDDDSASNAVVA